MSLQRRWAELDRLYAELPKIECRGLCPDACAYIAGAPAEFARIAKRTGIAVERIEAGMMRDPCVLLRDGRCQLYALRPAICRLYGVAEDLPCAWGCVPERYLSAREGFTWLARAMLAGETGEQERRELEGFVAILESDEPLPPELEARFATARVLFLDRARRAS